MFRSLTVIALLTACTAAAPASESAPEPPAFDVALVRSNFTDECADPIVVDDLFCEQVEIGGMTGEGDILTVPTGLNAESRDRAQVICDMIARAHFDGVTGDPLGYEFVGIKDQQGANLAACSVSG